MMKGAAEKPVQLEVMPGQAKARHGLDARPEPDRLMADFDRLLARHSAMQDATPEKAEDAPPDAAIAAQPLSTPEAAFLLMANWDEHAMRQASAVPPPPAKTPDTADSVPDGRLQQAEAEITTPVDEGEGQPGEGVIAKPKTAFDAFRVLPAKPSMAEPAQVLTDDLHPKDRGGAFAVAAHESLTNVEDDSVAETSAKTPAANSPVALIRVAGQETHFSPSPVVLVDDPAGIAKAVEDPGPSRVAPAPPPARHHGGPLRLLKVELGSNELGPIKATMALKDNVLDLRIGALRDEAVAGLRENAGKLSDALQSLGYSIDGVAVQKLHHSDAVQQPSHAQPPQNGMAGQEGNGQGQRDLSGSQPGAEGSNRQSRQTLKDDHLAEHESNDQAKGSGGTRRSHDVFL